MSYNLKEEIQMNTRKKCNKLTKFFCMLLVVCTALMYVCKPPVKVLHQMKYQQKAMQKLQVHLMCGRSQIQIVKYLQS